MRPWVLVICLALASCKPPPPALGWHHELPPFVSCSVAGAGPLCAWYECHTDEAPSRWWVGALDGQVWLCDMFAAQPCGEALEAARDYCEQPLSASPQHAPDTVWRRKR